MFTDRNSPGRLTMLASVAIVAIAGWCQSGSAQPDSPAAMRQQIATLEDELESLRARLATLSSERDRLRIEVEQLRRAMIEGSPDSTTHPPSAAPGTTQENRTPGQMQDQLADGPPDSVPISALSQDPLDSPDALFVALLLDYRETFASDPSAGGLPEPEAVADWIASAADEYEGPTAWLVRIDGIVRDEKVTPAEGVERKAPRRMLATVLDPVTLMPKSRATMIDIPRRLDGRFPERLEPGEVLFAEMRVKVAAACLHQPTRETQGAFDYPPFLGPYAGFGYTVDIVGLKFAEFAELRSRAKTTPPPTDR